VIIRYIYKPLISNLTQSDWIILWLYLLIAPAIVLGFFTNLIILYFKFYFIFSVAFLLAFLIKYVLHTFVYQIRNVPYKLSCENFLSAFAAALLMIFAVLLIIYSPLLINWDAVSVYIPIAESIIKTGSLHGPNIYYQTYQTMYAPPLIPLIMAFFVSNIGIYGYRLVPILFTIFLFIILVDFYRIFTNDAINLAIASFFAIIANPFYMLYFIKESMYLDLAFITITWAMIYELSKIIMFKDISKPHLLILWSIGGTLLIVSKEYGIFLFTVCSLLIFSLKMKKKPSFTKYFLSIFFILPFLGLYIWSIFHIGFTIGARSQILGSGILVLLAYLLYEYIIQKFLDEDVVGGLSFFKILIIVISISIPAILYYATFAIKYGIIGFINLIWIQEKFMPKEILAIITSISAGKPHPININYLQFFNYWNIIKNAGTFIIFASSLLLLPFVTYYRKRDKGNYIMIFNRTKMLLLILFMILIYYLSTVDVLNGLIIAGTEYRRSMLIISFLGSLMPVIISVFCEKVATSKLLLMWILLNIIFHIIIINPLNMPHSYLQLLNPEKTVVSDIYIAVILILGILFSLPQLFKFNIKIKIKFSREEVKTWNFFKSNKAYIYFVKIIILIFISLILVHQLAFISMHNLDPRWYDTIYSINAYYPEWGAQWINAYELLKDQNNSTILLEGSYPLAYFLKKSVIVYGNPNSLWFTSNGLLIKVMNTSSNEIIYIVRNKELSTLRGLFEILITRLNSTTTLRTYSLIYKSESLEIYRLEIKILYIT